MKPRTITGLGMSLLAVSGFAQNVQKPNVVFILADDMGWTALSERMDKRIASSESDYYQTPNIDRIIRAGVRFSNGYAAAPISSPSRHCLQTGMTTCHINHTFVGQPTDHIKYGELFSIPKMIKELDPSYACAHFGKWHLDCDPAVMGYDESFGMTKNTDGDSNVSKIIKYTGDIPHAGTWLDVKFSDDPKLAFSIRDRSIDFVDRCAKEHKPFYLQMSHYATHKEIISTEATYNKFDALPRGKHHDSAAYAAMLYDMDTTIGALLDKLEELGLMDNTYIVFMTDNGGAPFFPPNHPDKELVKGLGSNYPLQRGKWDCYEGGIRVPFLMAGPGIKPGSQCDIPVIGYDWLPTVADIVGYKQEMPEQVDGISFLPFATGEVKKVQDRPLYFYYPTPSPAGLNRPMAAIIKGRYKVIEFLDNSETLLFDLKKDISELHDLVLDKPEVAKELKGELDLYIKKTNPFKYDPAYNVQKAAKKAARTMSERMKVEGD